MIKFYRGTNDSTLTHSITVWYGNFKVADHKSLETIVRIAQNIIGLSLPAIANREASIIIADPSHHLLALLASGWRLQRFCASLPDYVTASSPKHPPDPASSLSPDVTEPNKLTCTHKCTDPFSD